MKPRTKLHHRVLELNDDLPTITVEQKEWAFKNCLPHFGFRTKKSGITCMDCGIKWKDDSIKVKCKCPKCDANLRITDTTKRKESYQRYMAILDVKEEIQVVRIIEIWGHYRVGQKPRYYFDEIIRQFFTPDGKYELVAKMRLQNYTPCYSGNLELRGNSHINKYDFIPDKLYPKMKVLPIFKRNGFKTSVHRCSPYDLLTKLISNNKVETLLKCKQHHLISYFLYRSYQYEKYWNTIKICLRKNYIISNPSDYFDYLDLLNTYKQDLKNPNNVCPENLKKAHDRYVAKRNREELQRQIEIRKRDRPLHIEKAKKVLEEKATEQEKYVKEKGAFFGLCFSKGNLQVKVLENIDEFFLEGLTHNHCVFTNQYFAKKDSLILSAQYKSEPVETVEVSLTKMSIKQSRGIGNLASKYSKKVRALVKANMPKIRSIYKAIQTQA
ncbi:PcfJ domain-containing protein [Sphingobacterium detergens]|uniref:PcfJ domain-containing protein n=1 Tax=Sphingobacterium detergens TaxID=1145106 RepID=UPI003AB0DB1A